MSADAHEAIEHLAGHRQRLRERFMAGDPGARSEEAVLELLLTYALPHQDVKPIARQLLADFGDLAGVLAAEPEKLCEVKGVKEYTVALLKAVGWITSRQQTTIAPCEAHGVTHAESIASAPAHDFLTLPLPGLLDFNASAVEQQPASATAIPDPLPASLAPKHEKAPRKAQRQVTPRSGTELFGKAMLQEAIDLLPGLPDTDSLEEAKAYLRSNLRFNSQQTRQRNSSYIARRMKLDSPFRLYSGVVPDDRLRLYQFANLMSRFHLTTAYRGQRPPYGRMGIKRPCYLSGRILR